jgi:hypothetical protein
MIKYQMMHGFQEPRQLIIWSLLVVVVVEQIFMVLEVVQEVIVLLVMAQVLYKDQHKN